MFSRLSILLTFAYKIVNLSHEKLLFCGCGTENRFVLLNSASFSELLLLLFLEILVSLLFLLLYLFEI